MYSDNAVKLNPQLDSFDCREYLTKLHSSTSLPQFAKAMNAMQQELQQEGVLEKSLVKEHIALFNYANQKMEAINSSIFKEKSQFVNKTNSIIASVNSM